MKHSEKVDPGPEIFKKYHQNSKSGHYWKTADPIITSQSSQHEDLSAHGKFKSLNQPYL